MLRSQQPAPQPHHPIGALLRSRIRDLEQQAEGHRDHGRTDKALALIAEAQALRKLLRNR